MGLSSISTCLRLSPGRHLHLEAYSPCLLTSRFSSNKRSFSLRGVIMVNSNKPHYLRNREFCKPRNRFLSRTNTVCKASKCLLLVNHCLQSCSPHRDLLHTHNPNNLWVPNLDISCNSRGWLLLDSVLFVCQHKEQCFLLVSCLLLQRSPSSDCNQS